MAPAGPGVLAAWCAAQLLMGVRSCAVREGGWRRACGVGGGRQPLAPGARLSSFAIYKSPPFTLHEAQGPAGCQKARLSPLTQHHVHCHHIVILQKDKKSVSTFWHPARHAVTDRYHLCCSI